MSFSSSNRPPATSSTSRRPGGVTPKAGPTTSAGRGCRLGNTSTPAPATPAGPLPSQPAYGDPDTPAGAGWAPAPAPEGRGEEALPPSTTMTSPRTATRLLPLVFLLGLAAGAAAAGVAAFAGGGLGCAYEGVGWAGEEGVSFA